MYAQRFHSKVLVGFALYRVTFVSHYWSSDKKKKKRWQCTCSCSSAKLCLFFVVPRNYFPILIDRFHLGDDGARAAVPQQRSDWIRSVPLNIYFPYWLIDFIWVMTLHVQLFHRKVVAEFALCHVTFISLTGWSISLRGWRCTGSCSTAETWLNFLCTT